MKLKNIIIVALAVILLPTCKKDDDEVEYTPIDMVGDVVWATSYYSVIFREAEDAWALVDKNNYSTDPITEENESRKKTITFKEPSEGKFVVDIEYNAWSLNDMTLMGTITIDLPDKEVYGQSGRTAVIKLTNRFSVNGQIVTGNMPITCRFVTEGETQIDRYDYKLNTASIHSLEDDKKVIITCDVTNGSYTRIEGAETKADPKDDVWSFTGTMTGMLRDDANFTYSNTVSGTEGETLLFKSTCYKALQGVCKLTVKGKSDMHYTYGTECDSKILIETIH
ncbi:MAG: hypothetical protein LBQ60_10750 [Bacteroidales bacterium]|nr:hypothetical protein [Bacteroidales bacterium]